MKIQVLVILISIFLSDMLAFAWECTVEVKGPDTIKLDQQVALSANGSPAGGSYSWSRTPHLVPSGSTATLTGFKPTFSDYIRVIGYYTSPKGKKCYDTKWLWVCACTMENIVGPSKAEIGQQVLLSTNASPEGGIYIWTIASGSGNLISNGPSATFVGDKQGPVNIKASYTPPEGGEPCVKFITIEISGECSVAISGIYNRPICQPENYEASGTPSGGDCSWSGDGIVANGDCKATYASTLPGFNTITATYNAPNGGMCEDEKSILSYSFDMITPIPACFASGSTLQLSDFNIYTTPATGSFREGIVLNPQVVTTNYQEERILVRGSWLCPESYDKNTVVTVVNKDIKDTIRVEFTIPDYIKVPLGKLGLDGVVDLSTFNSYSTYKECCVGGIDTSSSGYTSLTLKLPTASIPIAGFPIPKIERFAKARISVDITGKTSVILSGNYKSCNKLMAWTGGGNAILKIALIGGVKAEVPDAFVIGGEAEGSTKITENMVVVEPSTLKITTDWDGLTGKVVGFVEVPKLSLRARFDKSRIYFKADGLLPVEIPLPTLGN